MKHFTLLIASIFLLLACSGEKEKEKSLYNEVMKVHDEVMPEMGSLQGLARQLQAVADSLQADSTKLDAVRLEETLYLKKQLEDANESMMQWMRDFELPQDGTPHGEVIQYFMEQKKAIDKVRKDMLDSKSEAEKYFLAG